MTKVTYKDLMRKSGVRKKMKNSKFNFNMKVHEKIKSVAKIIIFHVLIFENEL